VPLGGVRGACQERIPPGMQARTGQPKLVG
jgi:hypothetical protein